MRPGTETVFEATVMTKQTKRSRLGLFLLFVLIFALLLSSCATQRTGADSTPESTAPEGTAPADNRYYDAEKLDRVLELFYQNFIKESDKDSITDFLLKGFIAGAGDIYCDYMTAEEYQAFNDSYAGNYVGIGVTVTVDNNDNVVIIDVTPASPAMEAGLQPSDILYKVDDKPLIDESGRSFSIDEVAALIRGEEGSEVSVTVLRNGEEQTFTMQRRALLTVSVRPSYYEYGGKTAAVIKITSFDSTTPVQFKAAIDDAEAKKADFIIYDLRNNPGGLLTSVETVLTYILPNDSLICSFDYKNAHEEDHAGESAWDSLFTGEAPQLKANANGGFYYNNAYAEHTVELPSAVLINGNSASAAELFTSVLRDYQRAVTVGETSYGKGCMQVTYSLGDGSALKVTAAYYNPPCGVNFDRTTDGPVGITPDVEVSFTDEENQQNLNILPPEADRQFVAAFNRLTTGEKLPQAKAPTEEND